MSVLFFLDKYPNLSETFIQSQIMGLSAQGFDVSVIALHKGAGTIPHNVQVNWLFTKPEKRSALGALKRLLNIVFSLHKPRVRAALLNTEFSVLQQKGYLASLTARWESQLPLLKADVIIAHFGTTAVAANILMQLGLLQGKLIAVFHGYDLSEQTLLEKYASAYKTLFSQASAIMPVSRLWADKLIELGCPADKVIVHRMGIETSRFTLLDKPKRLSPPLKLLSVARLVEKKGIDDAITAVGLLKASNVNVEYRIIGDGPLREQLANLIQALDLSATVKLLGKASHDEVALALANSDIFLLPSKTAANGDKEGIPVSLMEAMARGVLCLSTFHSGIPELISDGVDGFLVPENQPKQLAAKLRFIMAHHDLTLIREQARRKIENMYQQDSLNKQLALLIKTLHD